MRLVPVRRRGLLAVAGAAATARLAPGAWGEERSARDDLPWRGRFFGNPTHGDTPQPAQIKYGRPVVLVTPAERSGEIVSVRVQLRAYNKGFRPKGSPGDYSQGDGGQVRIQLRSVGADGLPTETVLAQTAINNGWTEPLCIDGVRNFDDYAAWPFDRPVSVRAGERFALYFENPRPDVSRSGDWVSTNFLRMAAPELPGSGLSAGPYFGDGRAQYRWRSSGWTWHPPNQGFLEVAYADGHVTGVPYIWAGRQSEKVIGGSARLRQRFTVDDRDWQARALWLRLHWHGREPAPLQVSVATESGSELLALEVPAARISRTANELADPASPPARWLELPFARPLTLARGTGYSVALAAATGEYRTRALRRASTTAQRAASRNLWRGARAEESADDGATWRELTRNDDADPAPTPAYDLALAFATD